MYKHLAQLFLQAIVVFVKTNTKVYGHCCILYPNRCSISLSIPLLHRNRVILWNLPCNMITIWIG